MAAPQSPGDVSCMLDLKTQFEGWSQSPDIYAVVLRIGPWPVPQAAPTPLEVAALTRLVWCLDCFPKPLVALIDGPLSGPPLALASVATHRVGTATYRFSAPPIQATGSLPLDGLGHALANLPGGVGLYLAMTGSEIGPADAVALGLLTHHLPASATSALIAGLADSQPVDPLLDGLGQPLCAATIAPYRATLDHCFSAPNVEAIAARLAAISGPDAAWAEATRAALARQSAPALAATYRLVTDAQHLDLRETLLLSYKLGLRLKATAPHVPPLDQLFFAAEDEVFSLPSRADIAFGRF